MVAAKRLNVVGKHQESVTEASRTIQLTDAPRRGAA